MIIALVATPVLGTVEAATTTGLPGWVTGVVAIIVALGGGGGFFQLLKVRADKSSISAGTSKARAEAADILSDTAVALLAPLRDELGRMQSRVEVVERRSRELEETLVRERQTSDTRIRQLEGEIAARDIRITELVSRLQTTGEI